MDNKKKDSGIIRPVDVKMAPVAGPKGKATPSTTGGTRKGSAGLPTAKTGAKTGKQTDCY